MAADREPPTATDYVVTALSPVLVMLMVGSLVFFLVEVLYAGKYSGRLLYTLFFFVAGGGAGRPHRHRDRRRAARPLRPHPRRASTYLALLGLRRVPGGGWLSRTAGSSTSASCSIWWSAHKLTWDCTHIDEKQKGPAAACFRPPALDADAGRGDRRPRLAATRRGARKPKRKTARGNKKKARSPARLAALGLGSSGTRSTRDAKRKGPHTPGVWVIYFALAALPLFALGQSLIDAG